MKAETRPFPALKLGQSNCNKSKYSLTSPKMIKRGIPRREFAVILISENDIFHWNRVIDFDERNQNRAKSIKKISDKDFSSIEIATQSFDRFICVNEASLEFIVKSFWIE